MRCPIAAMSRRRSSVVGGGALDVRSRASAWRPGAGRAGRFGFIVMDDPSALGPLEERFDLQAVPQDGSFRRTRPVPAGLVDQDRVSGTALADWISISSTSRFSVCP